MSNETNETTTTIIPVDGTVTVAAENANELDALSVEQLTMEAKFYYAQMGQNAVEFGKRLIAVKKKLQHGDWKNWLKENFSLSYTVATRFMQIAERFGNLATLRGLKYSQMLQLLTLPAGDEEKFIEEKAAEGKPVEKMTVKQLRADVKKRKKKADDTAAELENLKNQPPTVIERTEHIIPPDYVQAVQAADKLQADVKRLSAELEEEKARRIEAGKTANESEQNFRRANAKIGQVEEINDNLKIQIRKLQKQKTVEIIPADYEDNKKNLANLQAKISELQSNTTVEVVPPADYDATKKELELLKAQQENIRVDIAISQNLQNLCSASNFLLEHQDRLTANLQNFLSADYLTTENIKQLALLVTFLVNNVDGNFDI